MTERERKGKRTKWNRGDANEEGREITDKEARMTNKGTFRKEEENRRKK